MIKVNTIFRVLRWVILIMGDNAVIKKDLFGETCRKRRSHARSQRQRVAQRWIVWTNALKQVVF